MALTSPDHHLTLSTEKKNIKWNVSSTTDVMEGPECSSTSSSGEDTPKVTILGNQLTKYMLQNS
jgi:hypothetical protein